MAPLRRLNVGLIGTGWVGGIRAAACAGTAIVDEIHIAEINAARRAEVAAEVGAVSATQDWRELIANPSIDLMIISMTPETRRFPMVMAALEAGKHVFVEKPIAPTIEEADRALALARDKGLKITVGYSRRFDPRYAYIHKALKGGLIGEPVTCLISRQATRELGLKITGRSAMSPTSIGGSHDIDFALWCLRPRKPIRVYSQTAGKFLNRNGSDTPDHQWTVITMDDGTTITAGVGWILPVGYPNYVTGWIEVIGTDGALTIDDTHREISLNTTEHGIRYPLSTMPGEPVDHVFAGSMFDETKHFIEAVSYDRPVMVSAEEARLVMDVCAAADLSAERGEPVSLPRNDPN